jgi:Arc/MetJ family transcription regulator
MYDELMRTTIDLPDELHRQAMSIARDTSRSLSETVAELMRRGLSQGARGEVTRSQVTGLPIVRLGATITTDDVRALDDEQ